MLQATLADTSANGLAAVLVLDATYNIIPNRWVEEDLERLRLPHGLRLPLAGLKAAAGTALLCRSRAPRLARVASASLVVYFALALGAHARVRDEAWRYGAAAALLGWSGVTFVRLSRRFE